MVIAYKRLQWLFESCWELVIEKQWAHAHKDNSIQNNWTVDKTEKSNI